MICSHCGAENPPGKSFCRRCGQPLSMACPNCGTAVSADDSFCGVCGTRLSGAAPATATPSFAPRPDGSIAAPSAERRLVSVLFADLVGFTPLSESRDAEEVRELLTRYFDTARRIMGRYGGTIEKFIGDAVMAVWGTPVAQEDDAERAVRAALDLTDAVSALGAEAGAPGLQARAGVLTGEAAVSIGAEGQGMVAGDLVNTASRIQSAAQPGTVAVGETTRRSSEAAIVYEATGMHELKGKAEPIPLWKAVRVVAARGGVQRAVGLEAPFVGRDREMRLVKELFHACAEEGKAHLVSVAGIGGIGKSRLSWEFEKYADGLSGTVWWHRGRCLAYGEGVTYWALSEMVRMRAAIVEGEDPDSATAKLRETLEQHVPDAEERRWVEPRLAHLIGLEERTARDSQDLFAAWRLFFERLAGVQPTVLVFEDVQWADTALIDFIEYLLEWSRDHPLFVLTLARPELMDRRPTWGAGKRNFTSLSLEPLPATVMEELLAGMVPGLPNELRRKILDRAEGVPLYAVETVRMLLDRGLLMQEGNRYVTAGPVEALEVPETLQALIAARLDGLAAGERHLLQGAAAMGKVFTKRALSAITGLDESHLDPILTSLIRKEMLTVQADPRSPERGQYGFLQDLVRHVAYETLSKRERKAKHLAIAEYLQSRWGTDEEEIVEVVASHYLEAYRAAPDAPDAAAIRASARDALTRAGERAASLAATEEAQRYFEQAADLGEDATECARLYERAGEVAWTGGRTGEAVSHFERAIGLFESTGQMHAAARISAALAEPMYNEGRIEEAITRMEQALGVLSVDEPDEDLAMLLAQLARMYWFTGDTDSASARIERALEIAESLWLPEVLSHAFMTKGLVLTSKNRPEENFALMDRALKIALEQDLPSAALRAYNNLCEFSRQHDRYAEAIRYAEDGLALARRLGNSVMGWTLLSLLVSLLVTTGAWDQALAQASEVLERDEREVLSRVADLGDFGALAAVHVHRGELDEARRIVGLFASYENSDEQQFRAFYAVMQASITLNEGNPAEALQSALRAFGTRATLGTMASPVKEGFVLSLESASRAGDLERMEELLEEAGTFQIGETSPSMRAQIYRFRARLGVARGRHEEVEAGFKTAAGMFRELGVPMSLAATLLEHGEWLVGQGRADEAEPLLAEAREILGRLKATAWLERLQRIAPAPVGATA